MQFCIPQRLEARAITSGELCASFAVLRVVAILQATATTVLATMSLQLHEKLRQI